MIYVRDIIRSKQLLKSKESKGSSVVEGVFQSGVLGPITDLLEPVWADTVSSHKVYLKRSESIMT